MQKSYCLAGCNLFCAIAVSLYAAQKPLMPIPNVVDGEVRYSLDYQNLPNNWVLFLVVGGNVVSAIAILLPDDLLGVMQDFEKKTLPNAPQQEVQNVVLQDTRVKAIPIEDNLVLEELIREYIPDMLPNLRTVYCLAITKSASFQGESKLITVEEVMATKKEFTRQQIINSFLQLEVLKYGVCYKTAGENVRFLANDLVM
jgi:hypothetical protein